jgi:predicted metal-binding protein
MTADDVLVANPQERRTRTIQNPPLAQVVLCKGCCCGNGERKFPAIPLDAMKAVWKEEKLNRSVQLTVSGCLGPCKLANVVAVLSPGGVDWFGSVNGDELYFALVGWAQCCQAEQKLAPLPPELIPHHFDRF